MLLPNFPKEPRGSYVIGVTVEDAGSEADKLTEVKENIRKIARRVNTTILLKTFIRGKRWVMIWWPANEPRHEVEDELFYPVDPFVFKEITSGEDPAQGA